MPYIRYMWKYKKLAFWYYNYDPLRKGQRSKKSAVYSSFVEKALNLGTCSCFRTAVTNILYVFPFAKFEKVALSILIKQKISKVLLQIPTK